MYACIKYLRFTCRHTYRRVYVTVMFLVGVRIGAYLQNKEMNGAPLGLVKNRLGG